jgi:hypothetical protein
LTDDHVVVMIGHWLTVALPFLPESMSMPARFDRGQARVWQTCKQWRVFF